VPTHVQAVAPRGRSHELADRDITSHLFLTELKIVERRPGVSPEYLNVEQAAVYLGSTVWTIRGLIETRKIQAKKIGRRFIVRRVDLDSCWQQAEAA
jgi:excisionase family DNA binding protein